MGEGGRPHATSAIDLLIDVTHLRGNDGISPDGAFDTGLSKAKILKAVQATGFIRS